MRARRPRRGFVWRAVAVVLGLALGALGSVALLRWAGLEPVAAVRRAAGRPPTIVRDLHRRDDVAGYGLIPGASFRHTTREFDVVYRVGADGGRRVPGSEAGRPRVDVYGDSWTFGHGVEDDETYVARLQERWPDATVRNRGVMGYGTVHALHALRRDVAADGAPALVLYGFNPIHVLRNHVRASHLRNVAAGRTPLYDVEDGRLAASGWAVLDDAIDDDAPGLLEAEWKRTELFAREMERVASESGARFAVVLLDGPDRLSGWSEASRRLRTSLEDAGIEVVDLEKAPDGFGASRYFDDDHPNASWHAATAEAIAAAFPDPAGSRRHSPVSSGLSPAARPIRSSWRPGASRRPQWRSGSGLSTLTRSGVASTRT